MKGGLNMAGNSKKSTENSEKRKNILTDYRIQKEIEKLEKMFDSITEKNKKELIKSLIEEAAFMKMALLQAKSELKAEGLITETINAGQRYVKAHPATTIYEKYSKQYTQIVNQLIEYLPPEEQKKVSKLAALREA